MTLYQDCSSRHDSSKKHGRQGRGAYFQKPLNRFAYYLAGMFLWGPSTMIVQVVMIRQTTWPPGDGAYFPYISI